MSCLQFDGVYRAMAGGGVQRKRFETSVEARTRAQTTRTVAGFPEHSRSSKSDVWKRDRDTSVIDTLVGGRPASFQTRLPARTSLSLSLSPSLSAWRFGRDQKAGRERGALGVFLKSLPKPVHVQLKRERRPKDARKQVAFCRVVWVGSVQRAFESTEGIPHSILEARSL